MGKFLSEFDSNDKTLRPVACHLEKLTPAQSDNKIHDKQLLAVLSTLEVWRGEWTGIKEPFIVFSSHKNLQYFMTTGKLLERRVQWSHLLHHFKFKLTLIAG